MGANPVVETPVGVVDPIIPEGTPTPPTLVLDTATVPGSSFTFTTRTEERNRHLSRSVFLDEQENHCKK